jgi:hypothetical protein
LRRESGCIDEDLKQHFISIFAEFFDPVHPELVEGMNRAWFDIAIRLSTHAGKSLVITTNGFTWNFI